MSKVRTDRHLADLAVFFHRNGYVREPDAKRKAKDGDKYRKGYEVRLVANSATELRKMQRALRAQKFSFGSPYDRGSQIILPIYGKEAVTRFLASVRRGRSGKR